MNFRKLDILLACEESQEVTEQFILLGHNAVSCDIAHEGAKGLPHYKGDVRDMLGERWDLIIAHPTCTRLANSGVLRLYKNGKKANGIDPVKWAEMEEAAKFFRLFLDHKCAHIGIENPVQHSHSGLPKATQTIQPYQFGDPESKRTCLWLKNLPPLVHTNVLPLPECGYWNNQTPSGQNKLGPDSKNNQGARAKERSRTYTGIAKAMAEQWSNYILSL